MEVSNFWSLICDEPNPLTPMAKAYRSRHQETCGSTQGAYSRLWRGSSVSRFPVPSLHSEAEFAGSVVAKTSPGA